MRGVEKCAVDTAERWGADSSEQTTNIIDIVWQGKVNDHAMVGIFSLDYVA